jgi:hypothetical protein
MADPRSAKLRMDTEEPMLEKSNRDSDDPKRVNEKMENELPIRAKLLIDILEPR